MNKKIDGTEYACLTINAYLEEENKELKRQISDLEAKLAEKEQIIKEMEQEINGRDKRIDRLEESYYQETRQLEWVNEQLTEAEKQLEKQATIHYKQLKEKDQDKIYFAIEKLESAKKSLRDKVCLMENNEHCYPQKAIHWQDVVAIIGQQIKKIKGETK